MSGAAHAAPSARAAGMDAARGLALVLMTCTHTLRVVHPRPMPGLAEWLMRIEPLTPTLFALLLGWGVFASRRRLDAPGPAGPESVAAWSRRQIRRGGWLFAISVLLFVAKYGPQWPEALTSTGILACLGIGLAAATLLVDRPRVALSAAFAGLVAFWSMGDSGLYVSGINRGSFPLLPYVPFVLLGASWQRIAPMGSPARRTAWILGSLLLAILLVSPGFAALWGEWGMTSTFQWYYKTRPALHHGGELVLDLLHGQPLREFRASFWSMRGQLVAPVLAICGAALWSFARLPRVPRALAFLPLLGRHSLFYYVAHLCLLGIGFAIPAPVRALPWTWAAFVAFLVATGSLLAWLLERPVARIAGAPVPSPTSD